MIEIHRIENSFFIRRAWLTDNSFEAWWNIYISMNWVISNLCNGLFLVCNQAIVDWKIQKNLKQNTKLFFQGNVFKDVSHLFRPQWVNFFWYQHWFLYHDEAVCVSLANTIFGSRSAPVYEVVNGSRSTQITCCLTFTRLKSYFIYCIHTVNTIVVNKLSVHEKSEFWEILNIFPT